MDEPATGIWEIIRGLLPFIVIVFIIILIALIDHASAITPTINLAQGGNISFYSDDAPYFITVSGSSVFRNSTQIDITSLQVARDQKVTGYAWMFGPYDTLYPVPFIRQNNQYWFELTPENTSKLRAGIYKVYLQMPGPSGIYGISYDSVSDSFTSPFAKQRTFPLEALSPYSRHESFVAALNEYPSDEQWINLTMDIEPPEVIVKDNYIDGHGNLYLGGIPNLASGEPISGTIDPGTYTSSSFHRENSEYTRDKITNYDYMTSYSIVSGGDYTARKWSLLFLQNRSENLPSGLHVIAINLPDDVQTTIPFYRWSKPVTPIPTPEIRPYYAVDGSYYGFGSGVNTSPPQYPEEYPTLQTCPTVVPQVTLLYNIEKPVPETVLPNTTDNRTIMQRQTIYIGEKNLDVSLAVGWPDSTNGDYKIQYCDWENSTAYGDIIDIENAYHYDVESSVFSGRTGAWCHHDEWSTTDYTEPIAFFVENISPEVHLQRYDNGTFVDIPTTLAVIADESLGNETYDAAINITSENVTQELTPTPDMSGTINATPFPWWLGLVAIAAALLVRKHD
jgi:hypothetical protein